MNLDADMMRDQTDDPFRIGRGQPPSGIGKAGAQPINPQAAVGVEHDFDDQGIGQPVSDHRSDRGRSEEHTSELQSLMRSSYAVFCLKTKKKRRRLKARPRYTSHMQTSTRKTK